MAKFDDLIHFESANTALAFRERQYGEGDHEELIRDVMAMANAEVQGQRVVVIGVRDQIGGAREFVGVDPDQLVDAELYRQVLNENLEPPIKIEYLRYGLDEVSLGVLVIGECSDRPYMMRRDFSAALRTGDAWIRRGVRQDRLARSELERIYQQKLAQPPFHGDLRIGFPGVVPQPEIELPICSFAEAPSLLVANKIRSTIAAKERSNAVLGFDDSRIGRLMHAKLFGSDVPYEARGMDTLRQNLEHVAKIYRAEDLHYRFEQQSHKLNLSIFNQGSEYLQDASIVLEMPRIRGAAIADRIYAAPGVNGAEAASGYPSVQYTTEAIRISEHIGDVRHQMPTNAFREPLRLVLSTQVAGKRLPLRYILFGRNLPKPLSGTLQIHAVATAAKGPGS